MGEARSPQVSAVSTLVPGNSGADAARAGDGSPLERQAAGTVRRELSASGGTSAPPKTRPGAISGDMRRGHFNRSPRVKSQGPRQDLPRVLEAGSLDRILAALRRN
jgi:hypothetical protein